MIKLYFFTALSVLAALLGAYQYGRRAGEHVEQLKQEQRTNKALKAVNNVKTKVNAMSDDDVRRRLRNKWSRD
jgi:Flp pilus assembly protein TadB